MYRNKIYTILYREIKSQFIISGQCIEIKSTLYYICSMYRKIYAILYLFNSTTHIMVDKILEIINFSSLLCTVKPVLTTPFWTEEFGW